MKQKICSYPWKSLLCFVSAEPPRCIQPARFPLIFIYPGSVDRAGGSALEHRTHEAESLKALSKIKVTNGFFICNVVCVQVSFCLCHPSIRNKNLLLKSDVKLLLMDRVQNCHTAFFMGFGGQKRSSAFLKKQFTQNLH